MLYHIKLNDVRDISSIKNKNKKKKKKKSIRFIKIFVWGLS